MAQLTVQPFNTAFNPAQNQHPQITDAEKSLAEIFKRLTSGIDKAILLAQVTEPEILLSKEEFQQILRKIPVDGLYHTSKLITTENLKKSEDPDYQTAA